MEPYSETRNTDHLRQQYFYESIHFLHFFYFFCKVIETIGCCAINMNEINDMKMYGQQETDDAQY